MSLVSFNNYYRQRLMNPFPTGFKSVSLLCLKFGLLVRTILVNSKANRVIRNQLNFWLFGILLSGELFEDFSILFYNKTQEKEFNLSFYLYIMSMVFNKLVLSWRSPVFMKTTLENLPQKDYPLFRTVNIADEVSNTIINVLMVWSSSFIWSSNIL